VLEPRSTIRMEMELAAPACEIDVELDNPGPGRSFILLIGHKGGPFVQRVRLAGKARIYFDPQSPGEYVLLVSNPQAEPIVLRLRARDISPEGRPSHPRKPRGRSKGRPVRASVVGPASNSPRPQARREKSRKRA